MAGNDTTNHSGYYFLAPTATNTDTRRTNRLRTLFNFLLVASDVVMLTMAFGLGYYVRWQQITSADLAFPSFERYLPTLLLHIIVVIAILYFTRMYHQRRSISRIDMFRTIAGVVTIGVALVYSVQDLLFKQTQFEVDYPRSMFLYVLVFSLGLVFTGRELLRMLLINFRRRGVLRDNLLIVGTGRIARDMTQNILSKPELGYNVVGVVNSQVRPKGKMLGVPFLGLYDDIPRIIDAYQVEQVIIAIPDARRQEIAELVTLCQRGRVDIKVYPDLFAYMAGDLNVDDLGGTPLLTVRDIALRGWKLSVKRGLDLVGSSMGLVFLSPFMLLTAMLIRYESQGPVFYTQERMGLDGRPFPMIKFRSMRSDAEVEGPGWTVEDDPRVTRMGKFMRKTNWDEIPQLINVLLGHMSLVGPRPERPVWVQEFKQKIPRYMERHREKAGMTGWAQVNGLRGDNSIAERTSYDVWYVENWSLWLDIKIIIRTIWQTLTRQNLNAY
ncbi:MAG: undecaprenyl-phosphate glucose phosphotransferase [Anaerolineae bacterium]|nr:undecaprenyl-phosphate glucose phosphotransferase [Anaerolineae bacterium]